jgi:hypothetical protein
MLSKMAASVIVTAENNNNVDKLLQKNMALVRLLLVLSRAGDKGLPTLDLLDKLGSTNYGQHTIKEGEKLGYVERVSVKVPKGQKGNMFVINKLTKKGKQIVAKLTEESSSNKEEQI